MYTRFVRNNKLGGGKSKMLFRIEDSENEDGIHREYSLLPQNLPTIPMSEIEAYIADEIRKEINGANDRCLLSYSKSLGICLLKYNKNCDNEIHINNDYVFNYVVYYDWKKQEYKWEAYNLNDALLGLGIKNKKRTVCLCNFALDVSNNNLLDRYLQKFTGVGRKKIASPEKDMEVLLLQSPNDFVIKQYSNSIYLLYALVIKYGMNAYTHDALIQYISNLEDFRFEFCESDEQTAIIQIIDYLYYYQNLERNMSSVVIMDSYNSGDISGYYDPITQFHDIQNQWFEESFALSDYNDNVISDGIWDCYNNMREQFRRKLSQYRS